MNKSIEYFNEWCDTELNVTPGASYKEAVALHDQDETKTITHKKTRSLWDNLYFGIRGTSLTQSILKWRRPSTESPRHTRKRFGPPPQPWVLAWRNKRL